MAFRLGRHVAALSERLHEPGDTAESWTYVVPGITESAARALLAEFNEAKVSNYVQLNNPQRLIYLGLHHNQSGVYQCHNIRQYRL